MVLLVSYLRIYKNSQSANFVHAKSYHIAFNVLNPCLNSVTVTSVYNFCVIYIYKALALEFLPLQLNRSLEVERPKGT